MEIFISFSHREGAWVLGSLVPCLKAAGVTPLVDIERNKAGMGLIGQMDALQDQAERTLMVLTQNYFDSDYCRHEFERAIARDPDFQHGATIPLLLADCALPEPFKRPDPLYVDLRGPKLRDNGQWSQLLKACGAELGCSAPRWLDTRDELVQLLKRRQSVNLVVPHRAATQEQPQWKGLIEHLKADHFPGLGCVDLYRGAAASRSELVALILEVLGKPQRVPEKPKDLSCLDRALRCNGTPYHLALTHFDLSDLRPAEYGIDFFAALRNLIEDRCVTLLLQSRRPFMELVPREHPLSHVQLTTVELDCK